MPRADAQARERKEETDRPPGRYTIRDAIDEADELLSSKYGAKPEQLAVVQLATFLFGAHARDEFMRSHERGDDIPYGAG